MGTWNVKSMNQGKLDMVKQDMTRVNINISGSVDQNGWEWENLIQKAIVSTTVGKNTLEVEEPLLSMKDSEMQYLGAISKTIEWPWFISKATH